MENPPYYAPFNFIKQLRSSLHEAINHKVEFSSSFKKLTTMCMHICTRDWQCGGKEINQTVTFRTRFAYKRFMQH